MCGREAATTSCLPPLLWKSLKVLSLALLWKGLLTTKIEIGFGPKAFPFLFPQKSLLGVSDSGDVQELVCPVFSAMSVHLSRVKDCAHPFPSLLLPSPSK